VVSHADLVDATGGVLRVVRAAVVGLSASGLALLGHVVAGGPAPSPGPLMVLVLVVLLVSVALSGRRWTTSPLLAVLLGSQAVFHVAFGGAGAAHAHGGQHLADGSAMPGHPGLLMLVGHTVAAVVTALLLRRGEDWLWGVVALLGRAWRAARIAAERPVAAATRALPMCRSREVPPALRLLEHAVARRGPPAYLPA
jgi:hypothetical protein